MDSADPTHSPTQHNVPFDYSEGDEVERYLQTALLGAGDLSTGSQDLVEHMRDWPTTYHLSPQRADLLRLVAPLFAGQVLEVGSGCGAITRFLGESGAQVQGLEGSANRAHLARLRCRDLNNVNIGVGNFETHAFDTAFDVGVMVGVLEYSRKYVRRPDPVGFVLQKMRSLLKPEGVMVLAIENQLGLKYLAGAPEDHQGIPFFGVHGLYGQDTAVTFGKAELTELLVQAGFKHTRFLYPFPDYKLPHLLLTDKGARSAVPMVAEILQGGASGHGSETYARLFSEEASWPVLWRNGLVEHLANSFLVLASAKPLPEIYPEQRLASLYATCRRRPFCKETHIDAVASKARKSAKGSKVAPAVSITRHPLHPHAASSTRLRMALCEEPPIAGTLLLTELTHLLNTPHWSVAMLAAWAEPWLAFLRKQADGDGMLPGRFLDCHPCNLIKTPEGALKPFDLEWEKSDHIAVSHVMLRGLGSCLSRYKSVAAPAPQTPTEVLRLALCVLEQLGIAMSDADVAACFTFESDFQMEVYGRQETFFSGSRLQTRPISWGTHLRSLQEQGATQQQRRRQVSTAMRLAPEVLRGILEPAFDPEFYNAKYPDVVAAQVDPLEHYIAYGADEGRQPCPWFDAGYYAQLYPDVAWLEMNPLAHYLLLGKHQNRQCGPVPYVPPAAVPAQPEAPEPASVPMPAQERPSRAAKMARRLAQSLLPGAGATD